MKIFLGLLVLSFAIWGIGDIFRFQPSAAVVTVGDQEISGERFLYRFNRELRNLQARFGPEFDQAQARRLGLVDQVMQQVTNEALYNQQISELGLTASEDDILVEIQQNPSFRDSFGNFSRLLFEQRLRQMEETEQTFVASLKQIMARAQLLEATVGSVSQPAVMADAIYSYQQEKRVLEILSLPHTAMTLEEAPSEEELATYHREHKERFTSPEYRKLTFLTLRPADVAGEIHVDDQELHDSYDARLHEFTTLERRTVEQIVVQDKELASQITERLRNGDDFYAVAEELAGADKSSLALGQVTQEEMPSEIGEAVFALAVDQIGEPVNSPFGWHVFRVLDIAPGGTRSFETVKDDILNSLQLEKALDAVYDLSTSIEDRLAGGNTLEEIAEGLSLVHGRVAAVDASGRNREGQPAEGLPDVPGLLQAGFTTEVGEDLILRQGADGTYYLVRVDEIMPITLRPLAEVRDDVRSLLEEEKKAEVAAAEADRILSAVKGGKSLAELAPSGSAPPSVTEPLIRTQSMSSANLSPELARAVFSLPNGGSAAGEARDGNAHLVVMVKQVEPADTAEDAPGRLQLRQYLAQSMSEDLIQQLTAALQRKYDVDINDGMLDALFDEANIRG